MVSRLVQSGDFNISVFRCLRQFGGEEENDYYQQDSRCAVGLPLALEQPQSRRALERLQNRTKQQTTNYNFYSSPKLSVDVFANVKYLVWSIL